MDLGVDHSKRVLWTEKIVVLITLKEFCGFYTENVLMLKITLILIWTFVFNIVNSV